MSERLERWRTGGRPPSGGVLDAVRRRRSRSAVTPEAPTHEELLPLVQAAGRVADHGSLRPWRLIEIRGDARYELGRALGQAAGKGEASDKPLRASLLIAVVASRVPSGKAPVWEQDATAAGVAHVLSLLLDDTGWGVFWRTGEHTRSAPVRRVHGLRDGEELLGWLYVGGVRPTDVDGRDKRPIAPADFLSVL